ncbi:MAG: glucose-6-phosphate isomerase [Rhodothermales bacterium]|nr:glucose-6-phosphate isomerase [Rhodothermales bacterium]
MIRFDFSGVDEMLRSSGREKDLEAIAPRVEAAHRALVDGSGEGAEWLGWRRILSSPNDALLEDIERTAREIRERADVLLCVGIGGSYLGAAAVIDALTPAFGRAAPKIVFAGHHISGSYLSDLLDSLDGRSVYVNVISKSGTTLEPALAFRFIRQWMHECFDDADRRIIATTDAEAGALNEVAGEFGYRSYVIPDDVGGRFSVLTPVGLLPIASAGLDIQSLFYGAVSMFGDLSEPDADANPALGYAARRYILHEAGFDTEILSVFDPRLTRLGSWWQQLFGESEGKNHRGLFPAVCTYSTDLHSLGQFVQDGPRNLVETFLTVDRPSSRLTIPSDAADADGLNYLAGRSVHDVNRAAFEGTIAAHRQGGVPVSSIRLPALSEETVGRLIYFFEHAVAVGGYLLGVNPFDQPGVEAYKREMFSRLGRPGV